MRKSLPPLPKTMRHLPKQDGYPVPWFVAKVGDRYDFRVVDPKKIEKAIKKRRCWVCGNPISPLEKMVFVVGPMCVINRTTAEPPSHRCCAEWSAKACPHLIGKVGRRSEGLAENIVDPAGIHINTNVTAVPLYETNSYSLFQVSNGVLIKMGEPTRIDWYQEGRPATADEAFAALASGARRILSIATSYDGPTGVAEFKLRHQAMLKFVADSFGVEVPSKADRLSDQLRTSTQVLVTALEEVNDPRLAEILERARLDYYHDYFGVPDMPMVELMRDLAAAAPDLRALQHRVASGDFDATRAESDEWAASAEGQKVLSSLMGGGS